MQSIIILDLSFLVLLMHKTALFQTNTSIYFSIRTPFILNPNFRFFSIRKHENLVVLISNFLEVNFFRILLLLFQMKFSALFGLFCLICRYLEIVYLVQLKELLQSEVSCEA